jgi:hypothetical protein
MPSFVLGPAYRPSTRCQNTVRVVERILEVLDQFCLGFCRVMPSFFAIVGRFLALEFVEEGELRAGNVLYLFAEAAGTIEVSAGGDEGILVLGHGFGNGEEISLRELKRFAHALGD